MAFTRGNTPDNLPATTGAPDQVERWQMAPQLALAVNELLDRLPQAEGGDSMVADILAAVDPTGVNIFGESSRELATLLNRPLIVENLKVLPSEFDEGNLARYLRFDAIDQGEIHATSTSHQFVVIALAKLADLGKIPAVVEFFYADKWNGRGKRPINMRYLGEPPSDRGFEFRASASAPSDAEPGDDTIRNGAAATRAKAKAYAANLAAQTEPGF